MIVINMEAPHKVCPSLYFALTVQLQNLKAVGLCPLKLLLGVPTDTNIEDVITQKCGQHGGSETANPALDLTVWMPFVGFFQVLWCPPTVQRQSSQVNWKFPIVVNVCKSFI